MPKYLLWIGEPSTKSRWNRYLIQKEQLVYLFAWSLHEYYELKKVLTAEFALQQLFMASFKWMISVIKEACKNIALTCSWKNMSLSQLMVIPASQRASQNFCLLTYLHMYQVMEVFKWTPTVCDKNLLLGYRATKLPEGEGV